MDENQLITAIESALQGELGSSEALPVGTAIDDIQGGGMEDIGAGMSDMDQELTQEDIMLLSQFTELPEEQQQMLLAMAQMQEGNGFPEETEGLNMETAHLMDMLNQLPPEEQEAVMDFMQRLEGGDVSPEEMAELEQLMQAPEETGNSDIDPELTGYLQNLDDEELQALYDKANSITEDGKITEAESNSFEEKMPDYEFKSPVMENDSEDDEMPEEEEEDSEEEE